MPTSDASTIDKPRAESHRESALSPRAAKLRAIKAIDVATGGRAAANQCFGGLLDRAEARIEGSCLVLHGRTGAGKTHILRGLRQKRGLKAYETSEGMRRPLLWVEAPAPCTLRALGDEILSRLDYPTAYSLREHQIWSRVRANLAAQGVQILMIDEAHNMLPAETSSDLKTARKIADTLKALLVSEEHPIQIILSGANMLRRFVVSHPEIQRRSHCIELSELSFPRDRQSTLRFLGGLEQTLGFSTPGFTKADMPDRFMLASRGLVGRMVFFAQEAAMIAVSLNDTKITREYLGEAYRRPYGVTATANPFLMTNLANFQIPTTDNEKENDDLTFLRGVKEASKDDASSR